LTRISTATVCDRVGITKEVADNAQIRVHQICGTASVVKTAKEATNGGFKINIQLQEHGR
jgi:hypothetical protein